MSVKRDIKIELFLKNEVVLSSTARKLMDSGMFQFQELHEETTIKDDSFLKVGDEFPLVDFPAKRDQTSVKIVEIKYFFPDDKNHFERIEYFAEEL